MLPGASPSCVNQGPSGRAEDPSSGVGLLGTPPVCAGKCSLGRAAGSTLQYGLLSKTVVIRAGLPSLPYHTVSPLQTQVLSMVHEGRCKQELRWQHWCCCSCWNVPQVLSALTTASCAASHEVLPFQTFGE